MAAEQKPYLNTREDTAIRFLGLPTLMRSTGDSTNGSFGLMEHWEMPPAGLLHPTICIIWKTKRFTYSKAKWPLSAMASG